MTDPSQSPKIAIFSRYLPPHTSGQPIVLYKILKNLRTDTYCLISTVEPAPPTLLPRLPADYVTLAPERPIRLPRLQRLLAPVNAWIRVRSRARHLAEAIRKNGCRVLVACSGDVLDLPAAHFAARDTGVPLVLYLFDYYSHQFDDDRSILGKLVSKFVRVAEERIVPSAKLVLVPNEALQEEYLERFDVRCEVIRNPVDPPHEPISIDDWPRDPGSIRIIYTGAVYAAQSDALANLIAALELGGLDVEARLHVYTAQSQEKLNSMGLQGAERFQAVSTQDARRVQQEADIVFLPLSFNSPYPHIIRTSCPGKFAEYLVSGRPMLVHAPANAFVSRYCRAHQCAWVVDRNDPDEVRAALAQILSDPDQRQERIRRALARGREDFSVALAQSRFQRLIRETDNREEAVL